MRLERNMLCSLGWIVSLATLAAACGSDEKPADESPSSGGSAGAPSESGGRTANTAGSAGEGTGGRAAHLTGGRPGEGTAGASGGNAQGNGGDDGSGGNPDASGGNDGSGGDGGDGTGGQAGAPITLPKGPAIASDGTWELVGARGFAVSSYITTGVRNIELVAQDDTLFVGYVVGQNREARVWRYELSGGDWEDLGQITDQANQISLTIDPETSHLVAAVDSVVKEYDGSSWKTLGEGGAGEEGAVLGTPDGLFLAWQGDDYNLAVDRFVDGEWRTSECSMTRKRAEQYHLARSPAGRVFASAKLYFPASSADEGAAVYELNEELGVWRELGGHIYEGDEVMEHDLAASAGGLPYLAFGDFLGGSFSVIRYDGEGDWTFVGPKNILGSVGYHPSIAFAPESSVPVVAYTESSASSTGYPRVMVYSENDWVHLGDSYAISDQDMQAYPELALGDDGSLYVAYWDQTEDGAAITVKRYSEELDVSGAFSPDVYGGGASAVPNRDAPRAAWPVVGEFGFTTDLTAKIRGAAALAIDEEDQLYAGYIESSSTAPAGVWRFDGTAWSDLGDITSAASHSYGLELLHVDGTLYAAVSDGVYSYGAGGFSRLGDQESDGKIAAHPTTGVVYSVVYVSSESLLRVYQYTDGAWSEHSTVPVPQDEGLDHAQHHSIAVASDGTLYLAYHLQNVETLYLMKYGGSGWEILDTPVMGPDDKIYEVDLLLSPTDVPHLLITEEHATTTPNVSSNDLSVVRFEGGTSRWLQRRSILWGGESSGDEGLSSAVAPTATFTSDGTLYLAYTHGYVSNDGPLHVLRYDESENEFSLVGGRENATGNYESYAEDAQLAVDSDDNLYLGYQDGNHEYRLTVRRLVTW